MCIRDKTRARIKALDTDKDGVISRAEYLSLIHI